MKRLAPAKINLSLRVLGRRPDGFHEIETVIAPITLADEVELERIAGHPGRLEFICSDPSLPAGPANLAWQAAELFRSHTGCSTAALRITLTKRIPHGAGLGGGSSDAACVLLGLNELYAANMSIEQLSALAAELGSDVPFFLREGPAVCRGRGEIVEPLPHLEALHLLLLKPPFPVPTPFAYGRWQDSRELPGVRYSAQGFPWGELTNDLERPVYEKYFMLADMKCWLLDQPEVIGALMSGSGSTMFALVRRERDADTLAARARVEFGELWIHACMTTGP